MKIAFYTEPGTLRRGANAHIPPGTEYHKEFRTAGSLFRALRNSEWDLIVVGWNLRDMQGSDLLRTFRASFPARPAVVFLTCQDNPQEMTAPQATSAAGWHGRPVLHWRQPKLQRSSTSTVLRFRPGRHGGCVVLEKRTMLRRRRTSLDPISKRQHEKNDRRSSRVRLPDGARTGCEDRRQRVTVRTTFPLSCRRNQS